jgi:hypothetical protein
LSLFLSRHIMLHFLLLICAGGRRLCFIYWWG